MAEKKADLIIKAQNLGLDVSEKNTVVQIKEALASAATDDTKPAPEATAKAGKRSAKAVREAEELAAKEARKAETDIKESEEVKETRGPVPVTRPKIERRSKKYRKAAELIEKGKIYEIEEAAELVKKTSTVAFDATIELHVRLGVDPRQADQNVRQSLVLPHGTGSTKRVAVFAPAEEHDKAKKAGADIVGEAEFLTQLESGKLDFDVLIATPQMMSQLGRFAKVLGPKGLMPNPKSGTVTKNIAQAVTEAKAGRIEFRVDPQGIVHVPVGKASFEAKQLVENITAVMDAIRSAKPQSIKSIYILSVSLSSAMGPGIKLPSS